jgi:hypothetical protein
MTWATGGSASTQWLESLPIIDRPTMPIIESSQPLPPGDHGHQYYALQVNQAQCMAASASPIAASLIAERRVASSTAGHHDECSLALRQQVLTAAAAEAQNQAAASALQVYYSLAEGEAKRDVLDRSQDELDRTLNRIAQVRRQGLQIPFDGSEFERRKLEATAQTEELEVQIMRGNHQLRRLIGIDTSDAASRIWPAAGLSADYPAVDVEAEVQVGLSIRPEVQILRRLAYSVDVDTLDVVRDFLRASSGLMGSGSSPKHALLLRCIVPAKVEAEVATRRAQIRDRQARREREIAQNIREAAETFNATLRQVPLARERIASWDHRISDLEKLQKTEGATFAEISVAQLNRLEAEAKLAEAVAAVEKARAALREQQGLLVNECAAGAGSWCYPMPSEPESQTEVLDGVELIPDAPEPDAAEQITFEREIIAPADDLFAPPPALGQKPVEPIETISRREYFDGRVLR